MTLALRYFRERGDLQQERVILSATADINVGNLVLCRTRRSGDNIFPEIFDALWLPDILVSRGDFVAVYTKAGTTGSKVGSNGKTTHFFYWDRKKPLWQEETVAAVLMDVASWTSIAPSQIDR